jgi:hypothetical protein
MDVGAGVAAEAAGVPSADVVVIAAGGFLDAGRLRPPLEQLRARHGLPGDPASRRLHGDLTLDPVPPGLRDPGDPLPDTAVAVRPAILDDLAVGDPAPPANARRSIYLTLGTIFAQESGDLFLRVLAGLRGLDVDVLVTVRRELDPAELPRRTEPERRRRPASTCSSRWDERGERQDERGRHGRTASPAGSRAGAEPLVVRTCERIYPPLVRGGPAHAGRRAGPTAAPSPSACCSRCPRSAPRTRRR